MTLTIRPFPLCVLLLVVLALYIMRKPAHKPDEPATTPLPAILNTDLPEYLRTDVQIEKITQNMNSRKADLRNGR